MLFSDIWFHLKIKQKDLGCGWGQRYLKELGRFAVASWLPQSQETPGKQLMTFFYMFLYLMHLIVTCGKQSLPTSSEGSCRCGGVALSMGWDIVKCRVVVLQDGCKSWCCRPSTADNAQWVTKRFIYLSIYLCTSSVFLKLLLHEICLLKTKGR